MKKIKFKIISFLGKVRANISILLAVALLILVFLEVLVVKRAITTVLNIARATPKVEASQLVRINFSDYDKIVKRIQNAPGFVPQQTLGEDPFGSKLSK